MAFTHSKKARLWVDQFELTSYFSEFNMQGKAGTADVTAFGLGAKTYISGLQEGTITGKGFFGAALTDIEDSELTAALGRSTNMCVLFSPSGATAAGTRAVISEAAETDYQISSPVNNVVSTSMSAQADSGLSTGIIAYDPTTAAIATASTTNGTGTNDTGQSDAPSTTVNVANNTTNVSTFAGAQTLTSNSSNLATTGFSTSGYLSVVTSAGVAILSYNGLTAAAGASTFNNVLLVSGTGTLATNNAIVAPYFTTSGLVCVANVLTLTGTGSPTVQINIQHSDDNATWATLSAFAAITAVGGYYTTLPVGTQILRYLRAQIVTTGSTISTTLGIGVARQ